MSNLPKPEKVLILGSGYSWFTSHLQESQRVAYSDIPGMKPTTTPGHSGELVAGRFEGHPIWVFSGRAHVYEGATWSQIIRPVELASEAGASELVVTNAAGGIRPDMKVGDLMIIDDVLSMTPLFRMGTKPLNNMGTKPLNNMGTNPYDDYDSIHTPMNRPVKPFRPHYSAELKRAPDSTPHLHAGTYLYVTGPSYETPAEIRAFQTMGADAVGMSTAPELVTASKLGLRWSGVSLITNQASGLGEEPLDHSDIVDVASMSQPRLLELFKMMVSA
ncbi:MAG: purine-nucleoside phosphorylase [Balneolaceae bacterium]|nr:purine-nucleoside phosphorylase [Balneolaceae bacterium]